MSRTDKTSPDARTGRISVISNGHGDQPWFKKLKKHRGRKLRGRANQATRNIIDGIHRLDEVDDFDVHPSVEPDRKVRNREKKDEFGTTTKIMS